MADIYVVGYDGTDAARRAVDFAVARAKQLSGRVHLVNILEWSPYSFLTPEELAERKKMRDQELNRANSIIEPLEAELKEADIHVTSEVRHGHAGRLLSEIAKELDATELIIGRTGDSVIEQRLLGSLTITLAQASPVPLTIVP